MKDPSGNHSRTYIPANIWSMYDITRVRYEILIILNLIHESKLSACQSQSK